MFVDGCRGQQEQLQVFRGRTERQVDGGMLGQVGYCSQKEGQAAGEVGDHIELPGCFLQRRSGPHFVLEEGRPEIFEPE